MVVTPIPEDVNVESSKTAISQSNIKPTTKVELVPDPTDIEVEGDRGKRIVFSCNGKQYIFNFILKKMILIVDGSILQ